MKLNKDKLVKGKKFMITGGTGSFGKYIATELLKYNPSEVRIFSRDEDKQYSMQHDFKNFNNLKFIIGDVRDYESVLKATRGIDIVLHAAALKQIPSTEYNILQAVKTNILGAQNVVDACIENGIKKAIAISTDKAVEPVNVMGMTKGIQEKIFILGNKSLEKHKTIFSCVRYGNVIASRGSVIPLFKKQILNGGPITLTSEDMTRFILTLGEATDLVFWAMQDMKGGEIFVPNIKAIKIINLAKVMVDQFKSKNKKISVVGVRPGEKIHETLISFQESLRSEKTANYYVINPSIDLKGTGYTYKVKLNPQSKGYIYSSDKVEFLNDPDIKKILQNEKII